MSCLYYKNDELYIEEVRLETVFETFGTPCYVYSAKMLTENWQRFDEAFKAQPHRVCYAVKANNNIHILRLLAELGSGFDIVSGGELSKVLAAKGDPKKVIFSGVGKSKAEIIEALQADIYCFNIESKAELERIALLAQQYNKTLNIALRVNPNIDARTHMHISTGLTENKFGIDADEIIPLVHDIVENHSHLKLVGLACHIGSQLIELEPVLQAVDKLLDLYQALLPKHPIKHLNVGGGLGISYHQEKPPNINEYAKKILAKTKKFPLEIIIEPGRAIVGNAGVLLTRIEYLKHTGERNFAIVDAGMNDFLRPALYDAWQKILPLRIRHEQKHHYDIAGPVCESADFLGKNRELALAAGDLLAVDSAGAYGFSMSSNYNSRPRVAEVLISGAHTKLIRRRETISDLLAPETL